MNSTSAVTVLTCSKAPPDPYTSEVALCRCNEEIDAAFLKFQRKDVGSILIQHGKGVLGSQVGIGWICTILNSAGVLWQKYALYNNTA